MTATKFAEIDGVRIAFLQEGQSHRETIVLAPSMLFDKRMFVGQMSGLADQYNVIAYDHRGHGESSRRPMVDMTLMLTMTTPLPSLKHLTSVPFISPETQWEALWRFGSPPGGRSDQNRDRDGIIR